MVETGTNENAEGVDTVAVGAIVVLGESGSVSPDSARKLGLISATGPLESLGGGPIASLEVLGQSALQRTIQYLQRAGVNTLALVGKDHALHLAAARVRWPETLIRVHESAEVWSSAQRIFEQYVKNGVETALLVRLGAYVEFDFADLMRFHRDQAQPLTRVSGRQGPLDLWMLDAVRCSKAGVRFDNGSAVDSNVPVAFYRHPRYVNRLSDARALRHFVVDAFLSRCAAKPAAEETKPGVWIDPTAHVDRRARVVAPAYIGPGAKIQASALITRFSNVERGCEVDCGTVVEDSSILANTYLGTWLDVSHAIVDGRHLTHLHHNATVEVKDSRLIDRTAAEPRRRSITRIRPP